MYFYDDEGSRIFQEIMAMPEYYLTDCEMEILREQSAEIIEATGLEGEFNIVELGAGDGTKTEHLLRYCLEAGHKPIYRPIDISAEAIDQLVERFSHVLPELRVKPLIGDYHTSLKRLTNQDLPSLVLFLGSNIGNFIPPANQRFLSSLSSAMRAGDQLMIGVDLRKNPSIIKAAYDDPHGITARFNLNLLKRINRELGADFNLEQWGFEVDYNEDNGELRSYLLSHVVQSVELGDEVFTFAAGERIWTELSKKYDMQELTEMCDSAGFTPILHLHDKQNYFTDSIFRKA